MKEKTPKLQKAIWLILVKCDGGLSQLEGPAVQGSVIPPNLAESGCFKAEQLL